METSRQINKIKCAYFLTFFFHRRRLNVFYFIIFLQLKIRGKKFFLNKITSLNRKLLSSSKEENRAKII